MFKNKICTMCGKEFTPNCGIQKVCSHECNLVRQKLYARKKRGGKPLGFGTCDICGEKFKKKAQNGRTCSQGCAAELQRKRARENGRKRRAEQKKHKVRMDYRGDIRPWNLSEDKDPWLTYRAEWCIGRVTDSQLTPMG